MYDMVDKCIGIESVVARIEIDESSSIDAKLTLLHSHYENSYGEFIPAKSITLYGKENLNKLRNLLNECLAEE